MFKYTIIPVLSVIVSHLGYSTSIEELDYSKEKREILGYFTTPSKEGSLSIQNFVKEISSKKNGELSINLRDQKDLEDVSIGFLKNEIKKRELKIHSLNLTGIPDLSLITLESFFREEMEVKKDLEKRKGIAKEEEYFVDYLIKMDFSKEKPLSWLKDTALKDHLIFLNEDDLKEEKLNQNRKMRFLEDSLKKAIIDTHEKYYRSLEKFVKKDKS
ncbi:MAG: hypothetical protein HYS39_00450 [Proteobacteria bacterium]|nr:hypothetical protein [Pseudomonadota bacterium]